MGSISSRQEGRIEMRREIDVIGRARGCHGSRSSRRAAELRRAARAAEEGVPGAMDRDQLEGRDDTLD